MCLALILGCHASRTAQVRSGGRLERNAAGRQPPRETRYLAERTALAWHHPQQSAICIWVRLAVGVGAETYDLVGMKRMGNRVTQVANLLPSLTAAVPRRPSPWSGVLRRALLPEGLSALHRECSAMAHPLWRMDPPLSITWVALPAR